MQKIVSILVLIPLGLCLGDTLNLKSGENIRGTYLGGTARVIRMEVAGQVQTFDVSAVSGLQFSNGGGGNGGGNNGNFSGNSTGVPPTEERQVSRPEQPLYSSSNPQQGSGTELPAGTLLVVRMIDSVDSEAARLGDTFRASLDEPVMLNGQAVVPRGADVTVKLVQDDKSGKIAGTTILKLALVSMRVNDRMVDITTQDVEKESGSRGAKSAKVIGGTAALGAIIGGFAGGGKGAAIGAGSGAAVGTGAQTVTKAQRVKIPSETRLSFTLSYAVRI